MAFPEKPVLKFRLAYTKVGRFAFLGHLDTMRVLQRLFRRAGIEIAYTRGFHPKPMLSFSPALSLGVASLGEVVDVNLETHMSAEELERRLNEVSPEGLVFTKATLRPPQSKNLGRLIDGFGLLVVPAEDGIKFDERRCQSLVSKFLAKDEHIVMRKDKAIDVRAMVNGARVVTKAEQQKYAAALDWPDQTMLHFDIKVTPKGSVKPKEVAKACLLYTSPSPRDATLSRMPSSA